MLPPMQFDRRYLALRLRLTEPREPITIHSADTYVVASSGRRVALSGVQYPTGPGSYVTNHTGALGEEGLAESYLLNRRVDWVALDFDAKDEELGGTVTVHIGLEISGRRIQLVQGYRLDCESLGEDWPLLDRWLSLRTFSRYCGQ